MIFNENLDQIMEIRNVSENYFNTKLSDISSELLIDGNKALKCNIDLELQNIDELRKKYIQRTPNTTFFF